MCMALRIGVALALLATQLVACGGGSEPAASGAARQASGPGAKIIRVPQDQPTIAAAMTAASAGDTVRLAPGTYREPLALKAGVRVVGGPSTIDATGLDHGITANSTVRNSSVSAITVQDSILAGILLDGAEVSFHRVTSRRSQEGSGLAAGNARVSLTDCELSGNGGRGINSTDTDFSVEGSSVLDNGAAGIGMQGSTARISRSILSGNDGLANVRVSYGSRATLEQNQIAGGGRGVAIDDGFDPADPRPSEAKLSHNTVTGARGSGLVVYGGSVRSEGNHYDGNGVYGLYAPGQDPAAPLARVESEGDTFDRNAANGIVTFVGADVSVKDGSISENGGTALFAAAADVLCADVDCTSTVFVSAASRVRLDHVRLEDNRGGGVQAYAGSQVSVEASSIARNAVDNPAAGGVFANSQWQYDLGDGVIHDVDLPSSVRVRNSAIADNAGWGAITYFTSRLDLGGTDGGGNAISGNTDGAVANATTSQASVPAEGNWWGSADAAAIAAMMFGPVDFDPFLLAAP